MAKLSRKGSAKVETRVKRKIKFKKKLLASGSKRPRLVVFRSNKFLYAQIIDDTQSKTLCQANSAEKDLGSLKSKKDMEAAKAVGKLIAQRLLQTKADAKEIVFDRNGYGFHGRVKALADGAREAGLTF